LVMACDPGPSERGAELDNDGFRNRVATHVREVATRGPDVACSLPPPAQPLHVVVSMYHQGELVGQGTSTRHGLCVALTEATLQAVSASGPARERVAESRFVVELTDHDYALVEHQGKGVELVNDLVPVRMLDKAMLRQRIDRAAGFLLSMQRVAPGQPGHGAFHYSLDLAGQEREPRFVVGTTSKSIFTLIDLHALTDDGAYLDAARLAAEWLLSMQGADGRVSSELQLDADDTWTVTERESMLYTGQVLSALSRLYEVTGEQQFLDAAARTAARLVNK